MSKIDKKTIESLRSGGYVDETQEPNMKKYKTHNDLDYRLAYVPRTLYGLERWLRYEISDEARKYYPILNPIVVDYHGDNSMCYCDYKEPNHGYVKELRKYPEMAQLVELIEMKDIEPKPLK